MIDRKEYIKQHTIQKWGKDYLPVYARLALFNADHPDWSIEITPPSDAGYVVTQIWDERGVLRAENFASVTDSKFDPGETAATFSLGRTLALLGYGNSYEELLEERIADGPVKKTDYEAAAVTADLVENMMKNSDCMAELDTAKRLAYGLAMEERAELATVYRECAQRLARGASAS